MGEVTRRGAQRAAPPERQFRAVARELEQSVWKLLLRPSVAAARVLQLGAVVELMPDVYVQAVRLAQQEPSDRYVRLWCVVPTADGEVEERTLLCFYTPGFPDPQFTQIRPGMDLNLAWWDAVRERLAAIAEEADAAGETALPDGGADALPPPTLAPGGSSASANRPSVAGPAPPAQPPGETWPPAGDARRTEQVLHEAAALFDEAKRAREESFARRDQIERRLTELYFARYPFMRQATQHSTELSVGALIEKWARDGCPAPLRPGGQAPDSTLAPGPDTDDGPIAGEPPWPLALALESVKALIEERTRTLERLCELSGGHAALPRRDTTTGRLVMACERCEAQLSTRAPDQREMWLN